MFPESSASANRRSLDDLSRGQKAKPWKTPMLPETVPVRLTSANVPQVVLVMVTVPFTFDPVWVNDTLRLPAPPKLLVHVPYQTPVKSFARACVAKTSGMRKGRT